MRENSYFGSKLWAVLEITYTRKEMCSMLSFQVFCFYNATSCKMIRLEKSKSERKQNDNIYTLVSHTSLLFSVFCLPGSTPPEV